MIDFHIVLTRDPLVAHTAINSVKEFHSHVIPNHGQDLFRGRERGFQEGSQNYVSYVDDDDEFLLSPQEVADILADEPPAVFTNSWSHYMTGADKPYVDPKIREWTTILERNGRIRPHPAVFIRRDVFIMAWTRTVDIMKKYEWEPNTVDSVLFGVISTTVGWRYVPCYAYRWNISLTGLHLNTDGHHLVRRYFQSQL